MTDRAGAVEREWFVSYDVTARSIVLRHVGQDEQQITPDEALALRNDLMAAVAAHNEHRALRGEDDDA